MRFIFAALILLYSSAFADIRAPLPIEQCAHHVPHGAPISGKSSTTKVCREGYLVQHDNLARIPIWVSYLLTPETAVGCHGRNTSFKQDPALPRGASATASSYAKSGYDIGHYANNSDMRWSADVEEESNLFSNAAPQNPNLNRGAWRTLEDQTRAWVLERGPIVVQIASVYNRKSSSRLGGTVVVPEAFVKILIDQETREVLVFVYPNAETKKPLSSFVTSFAEAQRLTGLKFGLPKEPVLSNSAWPIEAKSARSSKASQCKFK